MILFRRHENLFYQLIFCRSEHYSICIFMFMRQTKTCICHLCFKRLYTDHSCRMDFVVIIWIDRDLAYRSCHRSDCMPVFIPVSFSRHTHSNSTVNIKRPLFQAYQKVSGYKIHLLYPDTFVFTYIPLYAVFYLHFQSALLSEDQSPPTDTHIRVLSIYMLRAYDTEGLRLFPHYLVRQ